MTKAEKAHLRRIKEMPCGCCDHPPPSAAHHILEGGRRIGHFAVIPLCWDCHQGPNGRHGDQTIYRLYKKSDLSILNDTIARLAA